MQNQTNPSRVFGSDWLKFMWKCERPKITKITSKKNNEVKRLTLLFQDIITLQ